MAMAQSPEVLQTAENVRGFVLTMLIQLVPCMLIAGPATAGTTYVIRNWARDEHAWIWSDFKDAWKQNWKESLLIMLINGLAMIVFYVNLIFLHCSSTAKSFVCCAALFNYNDGYHICFDEYVYISYVGNI